MSDYKKVMCPKCKEKEGLQLSTGDIYCFQCDETKSIFIFQDLDGESWMAFVTTESFAEAVELIKVEHPDMEYSFEERKVHGVIALQDLPTITNL